jgi:iron complex outermembrane recepter protein
MRRMSKAAGAASRSISMHRLLPLSAWLGLALAQAGFGADLITVTTATPVPQLADVTVTATRIERSAFEVPASISSTAIRRDTLGVNLSESLGAVAGLLARDRQNYAQDTQIAVRGFGARSTFGIRGVRLYVDGIPATQPDGQGQISHFNLATAERVEVLRGPFSALYGNSSGGVIQLFTADGAGAPAARASVAAGTAGTTQATMVSAGELGRWRYNAGYLRFRTDGQRGHSAAQRDSAQLKLGTDLGPRDRLTLLYNDFRSPDVQDPLGLTRAQLDANPEQTAPTSQQFNTRKSAAQRLAGVIYDGERGLQHWRALAYGGTRQVEQYLAVPVVAQLDARSGGGVVDLQTQFRGGELRWSQSRLVAGISFDMSAVCWASGAHRGATSAMTSVPSISMCNSASPWARAGRSMPACDIAPCGWNRATTICALATATTAAAFHSTRPRRWPHCCGVGGRR